MRNSCLLLYAFLMFSFTPLYSQNQHLAIKNSTLGATGGLYYTQGSEFGLNQVVGQSSLIGITGGNNIQITQGFLQPINLSLQANKQPLEMLVYPNPTEGELRITYSTFFSEPVHISVFSMTGLLMKSEIMINNSILLQLNNLRTGIYLIKAASNNSETIWHKIVLK